MPKQRGRLRVAGPQPDARVHRDRAARCDDDRVEIELGHLGEVLEQPADAFELLGQCGYVDGGRATVAVQQGAQRSSLIMVMASVTGGTRKARSARRSASTPPMPTMTSGPKAG